jgi:hypothetical protein
LVVCLCRSGTPLATVKKYLAILSLSLAAMLGVGALTTSAFAQGLVTFANDPTTLISITPVGGTPATFPASPVGSYYFGLLISTTAAGPFTFTGVYATNSAAAGSIGPNSYTPSVPGWAPGATVFYEVAGWFASMGATFNPNWLTGNLGIGIGESGSFGLSAVASGVAGGIAPQAKLSASISGDNIVISWTPTGGTLQSSSSLGVGETWSTVGTTNPATVPISGKAKFFRVVPAVYPAPDLFGPSGLQGFNLWQYSPV